MPTRKAIIPGFTGSRQLLRALHTEMRERKVLNYESSTSSGIHSNSDVSDSSELARNKKVEFADRVQTLTRGKMGKSKTQGDDYRHMHDRTEKEDASSSSGPDDDGDDDDISDDNNDGVCDDVNDEYDDSNASESDDDDFDDDKEAKETDDRIAWEHNKPAPVVKFNPGKRYAETQKIMPAYSNAVAGRTADNRRMSGPTSYVRLVKETEDEIELIRRKHGRGWPRQHPQQRQLTAENQKDIMAKRKSTNSITFMYGRRKDGVVVSSENQRRNSIGAEMNKQIRVRSKSMNTRAQDVEEHLKRIHGGSGRLSEDRSRYQVVGGVRITKANTATLALQQGERPVPRPRLQRNDSDGSSIDFPLKDNAAGQSEHPIGMRKAKSMERIAKQKTKALKNDISVAKLDVAEAKLGEFSATLRAKKARIEERHAKLCRRRAALMKAEQELDSLESKMDDEEEDHRTRERRIKNRERRVKQEEAGIRLKEESLRKREVKVAEGIEEIEQRRKIVEGKEEVQKAMDEIMTKKEELHGRDISSHSTRNSRGLFGKIMKKGGRDNRAPKTQHSINGKGVAGDKIGQKSDRVPNGAQAPSSDQYHKMAGRKSPTKDDSTVVNDGMKNMKLGNQNSFKRLNDKSNVMGLWI